MSHQMVACLAVPSRWVCMDPFRLAAQEGSPLNPAKTVTLHEINLKPPKGVRNKCDVDELESAASQFLVEKARVRDP